MDESRRVGVKELGHLVLYVRNLERSAAFYRDVLGWRQILPGDGDGRRRPRAAFSSRAHPPRAAAHRGRRGRAPHAARAAASACTTSA